MVVYFLSPTLNLQRVSPSAGGSKNPTQIHSITYQKPAFICWDD